MSQLIDGIAGSAMACILFWKWQHKSNHSFRNTCLLTPKIDLNMKINVANHSAKLEGRWARTRMYRAEIMDMWLSAVTCDQTNTVTHTTTRWMVSQFYGQKKWQGHGKVLRRVMTIPWIIYMHLLRIFDCKYMVPFFGDEPLASRDMSRCAWIGAIIPTAQLSSKLPHSPLWAKLSGSRAKPSSGNTNMR